MGVETNTLRYVNAGDLDFSEDLWDSISDSNAFTFESISPKDGLYLVSKAFIYKNYETDENDDEILAGLDDDVHINLGF